MSSLSARTAPFQVAFMRFSDLAAAGRARQIASFAGWDSSLAPGLPAPGMLYRGEGSSALTPPEASLSRWGAPGVGAGRSKRTMPIVISGVARGRRLGSPARTTSEEAGWCAVGLDG